jgi:hypothetical protein
VPVTAAAPLAPVMVSAPTAPAMVATHQMAPRAVGSQTCQCTCPCCGR